MRFKDYLKEKISKAYVKPIEKGWKEGKLKKPGMLRCPKCGKEGPQSEFLPFKMGRERLCKECAKTGKQK